MKKLKRIMSLIIAVTMITALFAVPGVSYGFDPYTPADPENGSYDDMISYFQQHMKKRHTEIEYTFDTYDYNYVNMARRSAPRYGVELYDNIVVDIFTKRYSTDLDPLLGDYLYNSTSRILPLESVYTARVDLSGVQYYTFEIKFNFEYYTTYEQECKVENFLNAFTRKYLKSNMTEYQKVKTIYDFIVRNTTYDHEVYEGNYPVTSERYMLSHSAYGAIYGNLLKDGKDITDFENDYKLTLTGERVIDKADQGLAVCEGYSKLFYALCIMQGIDCRIVDGDNDPEYSQKPSDPHEWNFVRLDDGVKEDGYRWYQVDTTFASQNSMKEINMQNYDFFLRGYNSVSFNAYYHQMPYENFGLGSNEKEQLYDWYTDENISSGEDYAFPSAQFNVQEEAEQGYILRRVTRYDGEDEDKVSYIYTDLQQTFFVAVDEEGKIMLEEIDGFGFTGTESHFDVVLPYLIPGEEYYVQGARATAAGDEYYITIGTNDVAESLRIPFSIFRRDMSNGSGNYSESEIQTNEPYSGSVVQPKIEIKDGYSNELYYGRDFDVFYYSDAARTEPATLKDIGTYWCDIRFKGNYCGNYYFSFQIGKADLSRIAHPDISLPYLPKAVREKHGLNTVKDIYLEGADNLNIGGMTIKSGEDYDVYYNSNSNDSLSWKAKGTITLKGLATSNKVENNTSTSFEYEVNQKYDISDYDKKCIDAGTYYYSGKAITPETHEGIDSLLVEGVDYKVVSYSDNVNAGTAKVKIQGINGCEGTVTMYYYIQPLNIGNGTISDIVVNNDAVSYKFHYGSTLLVKNTDYTEKFEKTSTGYKLTLTGKGNYNSSYIVNLTVKKATTTTVTVVKKPNVKKTKVTKLTPKKKSMTVYWNKVGGNVTGYRIEYSTSSKFTKKTTVTKYIKGASKKAYTIKKLKSKKKYYVRVRTYYQKGKYIYLAPVSNVKAVKVK